MLSTDPWLRNSQLRVRDAVGKREGWAKQHISLYPDIPDESVSERIMWIKSKLSKHADPKLSKLLVIENEYVAATAELRRILG